MNSGRFLVIGALAAAWGGSTALAGSSEAYPNAPVSEYVEKLEGGLDPAFCSEWNPEFGFRGQRCCPKAGPGGYRVRRGPASRCAPGRVKGSYCDEMTEEQKDYSRRATSGELGDLLRRIAYDLKKKGQQAHCGVNSGFLAWGRRLIPTEKNRIQLRAPKRCVDFGTDEMIGMLEWVGRRVASRYPASEYPGGHLLVGDISAPRGGCLSGRGGRRGHVSHTSGQDVDLGFLNIRAGRTSPSHFSREFHPEENWWVVKQIFENPFACIKVIFLDTRLIRKLAKAASQDPDWARYRKFIRHVKGHRNHFHVRIGEGPGLPGCESESEFEFPDSEFEEEIEELNGASLVNRPDSVGSADHPAPGSRSASFPAPAPEWTFRSEAILEPAEQSGHNRGAD